MKDKLFKELANSIKQGRRILKGESKPSRTFQYGEPDVRAIRYQLGLSQGKFSLLLGISPATLRNWEQHRRKPHGAARVLLRVAARNPKSILESVHG
jgi:putative transcriptional regulator